MLWRSCVHVRIHSEVWGGNLLMENVILLRYGELALKGKNRYQFINQLVSRTKAALLGIDGSYKVEKFQGRVIVSGSYERSDAIDRISRVFGLVGVCPVDVAEKNMESIYQVALEHMKSVVGDRVGVTFKVEGRRSDKTFEVDSMELARNVGGYLLDNIPGLKVDVHKPEVRLHVEIREKVFIHSYDIPGPGGLPLGSCGRACVLLSGGIDSPVASWMTMKRGVETIGIHFHSFPFTSERAKEKVIDLAKQLAVYSRDYRLYIVSFTELQKHIAQTCREDYFTLIMRRLMMRISEKIAQKEGALALVTGESIGQVASQTLEGLAVTNAVVEMPILRPLICMDKEEIVQIAQRIGTYEISTLPYEDCCTMFAPKHPSTKPRLDKIIKEEAAGDWEGLIGEAIASAEILHVRV